ncbi:MULTISPECIES: lipid II:glycine glycyltransferase FemX [unclassified Staphylococcus]|uniref:lipid II:glycine glycyltransferase FemX n=1 Tax=unclassified Staphylococcus TaxID=91994 RepID=UPI00187E3872|nr:MULTISPECIES: lipid II:glycine glycyltransferase FemX [unclassified Staphylococcus]MBF2757341.1 lipid II:glycine glycyltransferase FemX [Staphylococcus haemolyticus]MBF2774353.1 lipid II:glycine glycyltransferase FemX [Staphylococcus haemolyticus]MBF2776161.1 lipid II:glycine glycyltransferase FemX [Staphylococcus haemolyticus]MBF2815642.1 lipid II:glycine glycyltransferase FemX [Staphylococcus haemolyticus]MBF9719637.1 lipid II:glycine glycyltransferase FemX [Staphylococcus haemolyticus]
MEKMNITNQEHDAFVKAHPNGDLLQLTKWAETKRLTGWYSKRVAVGEDGEIKGVGQLLFKKIPKLPFTLCYVSRGFVTDYSDKAALEQLLAETKKVAKAEKAYAIKIDPDVEVDKGIDALKNLNALGFKHKGFKEGLSKDYIQPRMTMITPIDKTDEEIIQSFDRRNRSKVRLALKRGTKVERSNREGLKTFAELMKVTGERDGFLTRDISYFQNIYDSLHEDGDAELFLVKLEPKPVLEDIHKELQELDNEKAQLQDKYERKQDKKTQNKLNDVEAKIQKALERKEDMNGLLAKHPEGVYLSGALLMFAGSKSYYLYGASSNDYRDVLPNHHMQFEMMKYARAHGATTYDFGGTDNNPDKDSEHYGLWAFKRVWGTYLSEKIGEFDYVLNQPLYQLIEQVKPRLTKAKIKISRKLKGK